MVIVNPGRLKREGRRRRPKEILRLDDDDSRLSRTTLFVSTIPYSATNENLEKFFSEIGPIKSCFVVRDTPGPNGEFRNKGCGLVCYSFREDALKARDVLRKKLFMGIRRLKISIAIKKNERILVEKRIESMQNHDEAAVTEKKIGSTAGISTIFLGGLDETSSIKLLGDAFSQIGTVTQIKIPVAPSEPLTAKVVIHDLDQSGMLNSPLFPKVLSGKKLKSLLSKTDPSTAQAQPQEAGKIMIENIPFQSDFKQLCDLLSSHFQFHEISLPRDNNGKLRGFAFVRFPSPELAAKAVSASSKIALRLGGRSLRLKLLHSSKEQTDNNQKIMSNNASPASTGDENSAVSVKIGDTPQDVRKAVEKHDGDSLHGGFTLFINNLPYGSTDEDLLKHFAHWGKLRFAKVTPDKERNRAAVSGFVCYHYKLDADRCLSDYRLSLKEQNVLGISANFTSLVAPELPRNISASKMFIMSNRILQVKPAVPKSQIEAAENPRNRESRNLYLLMEGVVLPDSSVSRFLTNKELETRMESYRHRKVILASSPHLALSKTRLSVRNLHKSITEQMLKKSAVSSVRLFWSEVQRGKRPGLEQDLLSELPKANDPQRIPPIIQVKIVRQAGSKQLKKSTLPSKGYGFIQFKFHCDALAFLRYANNNPFAITARQQTKPIPDTIKTADILPMRKPIIEFSIENTKILAKRASRRNGQLSKTSSR